MPHYYFDIVGIRPILMIPAVVLRSPWRICDRYSSKKSLHGTDWRFQCREVGDYRVQSSGVAASCLVNKRQFGK
jgi:hypothetical protein